VIGNNIINYWHLVPKDGGKAISVTQVTSMHIGGKMNNTIKNKMATNT